MESTDTVSLSFDIPQDLRPAFKHGPGQFVSISVDIEGNTQERSYSISSLLDEDDCIRITVKRVPGGRVSNHLVDNVGVGSLIDVATPRGRFFEPPSNPIHAVLLGAGSGIAPLVPIARHLVRSGGHHVTVACGQRTEDDLILREELEALEVLPQCDVTLSLTQPTPQWTRDRGRLDRTYLKSHLPAWQDWALPPVIYLCGPDSFMREAEDTLLDLGFDKYAIRKESFSSSLDEAQSSEPDIGVVASDPGQLGDCLKVSANVGGDVYEAQPNEGESILASLLRCGADVPYSCMEGTCASCIARVKVGTVDLKSSASQILPVKDIEDGLVLACLARPRSTHVVVDFDDL